MPSKSRFNYRPLKAQQLRELATLITSGIPLADAWAKAATMAHPAGPVILQQLQKGSSLPAAMKFLELISAPQQVTLSAANNAGTLSQALQQLAADYENREAHQLKLKSKFYLLCLLLFVGWSASLALVAAQGQGLLAAFVSNTLWCLICYAIIHKTVSVVLKDGWWWLVVAGQSLAIWNAATQGLSMGINSTLVRLTGHTSGSRCRPGVCIAPDGRSTESSFL
jgi:hypothetical protein